MLIGRSRGGISLTAHQRCCYKSPPSIYPKELTTGVLRVAVPNAGYSERCTWSERTSTVKVPFSLSVRRSLTGVGVGMFHVRASRRPYFTGSLRWSSFDYLSIHVCTLLRPVPLRMLTAPPPTDPKATSQMQVFAASDLTEVPY
jgi:hypothetical protein